MPGGRKVGFRLTDEMKQRISEKLKGRRTSPHSEFKKGQAPHNAGTRTYTEHACENPECGKTFRLTKGYSSKGRYCSIECRSACWRGEHHPNWKGEDNVVIRNGYRCIRRPEGGYQYEHCTIAEKALGRRLKKGEVVHHLNGDKRDNDRRNLLVCTSAYHRALEHRMCLMFQRQNFPSFVDDLTLTSGG